MVINVSGGSIEPHSRIERRRMTDNEARQSLSALCGGDMSILTTMPKIQRNPLIRKAIGSGVGMRQLARISGLEYKSIYLIINPNPKP